MKVKMPFPIEALFLSFFIVIMFVVWSYKIDILNGHRILHTEERISQLEDDYAKVLFELDQKTKGRWTVEMEKSINNQIINYINDPTNSPTPNVFEIKGFVEPSLP